MPADIKHGDPLICSFSACRNRGVKFLYCSFCKDAVSKLNFRNRHNHPETKAAEDAKEREKSSDGANISDSNGRADGVNNNQEEQRQGLMNPPTAAFISGSSSNNPTGSSSNPSEGSRSGSSSDPPEINGNNKRPASSHPSTACLRSKWAKLDPSRTEAWDFLLVNRPEGNDAEGMNAWIQKVMAVSDSKRPVPGSVPMESVLKSNEASNASEVPSSMTNESSSSFNDERNSSSATDDGSSNDESNETSSDSNSNSMSEERHSDKRKAGDYPSSATTDGSSNDESNETSSDSNSMSNRRHMSNRQAVTYPSSSATDGSSNDESKATSSDSNSNSMSEESHSNKRKASASCLSSATTDGSSNHASIETSGCHRTRRHRARTNSY